MHILLSPSFIQNMQHPPVPMIEDYKVILQLKERKEKTEK